MHKGVETIVKKYGKSLEAPKWHGTDSVSGAFHTCEYNNVEPPNKSFQVLNLLHRLKTKEIRRKAQSLS